MVEFLKKIFGTIVLLSGGLGLIGHSLVSHGCTILQRNLFSFHQNQLCYLEYFQEGNGLLGCHLMFHYWNIELQILFLK